jgi:cobalt/nickel transport protein
MNTSDRKSSNRLLILGGLGLSLAVAVFVSPFASSNPDGLDRVSEDLGFVEKAASDDQVLANKLPFASIFEEYSFRGVPEPIATPVAGLLGTLATFGLAWGMGKLIVKKDSDYPDNDNYNGNYNDDTQSHNSGNDSEGSQV